MADRRKVIASLDQVPSPAYILEESKLIANLERLKLIRDELDAEVLLALKAFALPAVFPLISQYLDGVCASGLWEARLGKEEFGLKVHTSGPAYSPGDFSELIQYSDAIVFNSWSQFDLFSSQLKGRDKEIGLRINPERSEVGTALYNPAGQYSRLGIRLCDLPEKLPAEVSGFHIHIHFEDQFETFARNLSWIEERFSQYFPQIQWINFGGGHHYNHKDYKLDQFLEFMKNFKNKYGLKLIFEPGSATLWEAGFLLSRVLDFVDNEKKIALLDTSVEAHMPDCVIMPYRPMVKGASEAGDKAFDYRLAGSTCLAGDVMGDYSFDHVLKVGDPVIFQDMLHYTFVKNNTFNGVKLPGFYLHRLGGQYEVLKEFAYSDFLSRLK